jgi:pimeloyl-ACP methyl ester carboxylesterase
MSERIVEADGIELCTEAFGVPRDPPILLIHGLGASMLWWDEDLCRRLADGGRYVIRYDHRDTGRSVTYPPGRPGYTSADLVTDAAGVLDAHGIAAAHVVGVSAGGAIAQSLALGFPDRVLSLALISTSPAVPVQRALPPPTADFKTVEVDWSDPASIFQYQVGYARMLAGNRRPFDEAAIRHLVRRDIERADSVAALQNHDIMAHDESPREPLSSIAVPTLVVHGTADPMFPLPHGEALAEAIPTAQLLTLTDAGHGVDRADWDTLVPAILNNQLRRR